MRVTFKGEEGLYSVGECGIVDLESFEELEDAVLNKAYGNFEKRELFWMIYDQIILPTREQLNGNDGHGIRLLYIEDDGDKIVLHYNVDDYDESYCEITDISSKSLDEVMEAFYEDLCNLKNALPEDEPLKDAITWDKDINVNIPDDYLKRIEDDVIGRPVVIEKA